MLEIDFVDILFQRPTSPKLHSSRPVSAPPPRSHVVSPINTATSAQRTPQWLRRPQSSINSGRCLPTYHDGRRSARARARHPSRLPSRSRPRGGRGRRYTRRGRLLSPPPPPSSVFTVSDPALFQREARPPRPPRLRRRPRADRLLRSRARHHHGPRPCPHRRGAVSRGGARRRAPGPSQPSRRRLLLLLLRLLLRSRGRPPRRLPRRRRAQDAQRSPHGPPRHRPLPANPFRRHVDRPPVRRPGGGGGQEGRGRELLGRGPARTGRDARDAGPAVGPRPSGHARPGHPRPAHLLLAPVRRRGHRLPPNLLLLLLDAAPARRALLRHGLGLPAGLRRPRHGHGGSGGLPRRDGERVRPLPGRGRCPHRVGRREPVGPRPPLPHRARRGEAEGDRRAALLPDGGNGRDGAVVLQLLPVQRRRAARRLRGLLRGLCGRGGPRRHPNRGGAAPL
jgi:hypothetical protein